MANAFTKIADVVGHDSFAQYFNQAVIDRSRLLKSGLAATDATIAAKCAEAGFGGNFVNLPFFNALDQVATTGMESINTKTVLTVDKITASEDVAVITTRGKAFGAQDVAGMYAGADPLKAIADSLADWVNVQEEAKLLATLKGAVPSTLTLDITGNSGADAYLSSDAILDAAQLLGVNKTNLTAMAMHSAVENYLVKLDGKTTGYVPSMLPGEFARYMGKSVVTDDNVPYTVATDSGTTTKTGTIYLFASGAIAMNECPCENPFETVREGLASQSALIVRRRGIMHLRGVKWATTTTNPSDTDLATASNWSKVYPDKAIRVVKLVGKIA